MFRADLHAHTTCSDGSFIPEELVVHAKEVGLSALCITDHDNVDAYPSAIPKAKEIGLILAAGVEFSSVFKEMSVHILGYDIILDHPDLLSLCQRHKQRRIDRNRAILEKLAARGMPISEEELMQKGTNLGRPHIAQIMIEKGYVATIKQAFQLHIGDDAQCFVRGESISSEETIEQIHKAGGKAFLAHPHLMDHQNKIRELLKLPFDGIECHYAKFLADQEKRWIKMAKERQLLISGGSDFHGAAKSYIPLGCSWVDEQTFNQIFQRRL
ncbi:MAG: PHP domain-containing protein [Verrucomicrobia bacterium]|nr:PHP domain-containing protein [Verrucomicrobiota bacterium]